MKASTCLYIISFINPYYIRCYLLSVLYKGQSAVQQHGYFKFILCAGCLQSLAEILGRSSREPVLKLAPQIWQSLVPFTGDNLGSHATLTRYTSAVIASWTFQFFLLVMDSQFAQTCSMNIMSTQWTWRHIDWNSCGNATVLMAPKTVNLLQTDCAK